jgi:DNA-binding transcriptional LysR family regulator
MLEASAGERLLERTTRRLAFTPTGLRHLETYREMIAMLEELDAPRDGKLAGTVTITAPELFGQLVVAPAIQPFRDRHPEVLVRLLLLNRLVDLVEEGVDLAIRIAEPNDGNFEMVTLGQVEQLTCASPGYLDDNGVPAVPDDLDSHRCIGLNAEGFDDQWRFSMGGRLRSRHVRCEVATNNAGAAIEFALRGAGLIRVLSYQVEEHLASGALTEVLREFRAPPLPIQVVHRRHVHDQGLVGAVVEHLAGMITASS